MTVATFTNCVWDFRIAHLFLILFSGKVAELKSLFRFYFIFGFSSCCFQRSHSIHWRLTCEKIRHSSICAKGSFIKIGQVCRELWFSLLHTALIGTHPCPEVKTLLAEFVIIYYQAKLNVAQRHCWQWFLLNKLAERQFHTNMVKELLGPPVG